MRSRIIGIVLLLLLGTRGATAVPCEGGAALPQHAGRQVTLAANTLFFATPQLELDHDGSPEAYGIRDQGLENICNGLGPLMPPQCRGRNRGECFSACQRSFAAWSRSGRGPEALGETMCSIGLGGGNCSTPAVRLQAPPRQDWFVSETSVKLSPPAGTSASGWISSQPAQLDPARVPYFVIPAGFRRAPWDATPGDAGIALDATSGRLAAFVVGDVGGALNEASTALHAALRGAEPPTGQRTTALGEQVRSYLGGTRGDFRIAIFRQTSTRKANSLMLGLTSEQLGPWIENTVRERLAAIGGVARLRACTGG